MWLQSLPSQHNNTANCIIGREIIRESCNLDNNRKKGLKMVADRMEIIPKKVLTCCKHLHNTVRLISPRNTYFYLDVAVKKQRKYP